MQATEPCTEPTFAMICHALASTKQAARDEYGRALMAGTPGLAAEAWKVWHKTTHTLAAIAACGDRRGARRAR